ncbi:hypothetical protein ABH931_005536 [Streptacidiphilus sp. MAP12-33]|uniref:hypothetical protein n=1 Tax=Streptacidiphilus sp. MAP12-33 TaxID=3156266 RepID=UPI00351602BC
MFVTISLVVLFGAAALFMIRNRALAISGGLVAALFGFYLARTGAAPTIGHAVTAVIHYLNNVAH